MPERKRSALTLVLGATITLVVAIVLMLKLPGGSGAPLNAPLARPALEGPGPKAPSAAKPLIGAAWEAPPQDRVAHERLPVAGPAATTDAKASPEENALKAGELDIVVRQVDQSGVPGPVDGWVSVQRLDGNDLASPLDPSRATHAELEAGTAHFDDLPRGVLLVAVHVGSDPPHRRVWVNSLARGTRLEFELGMAQVYGQVRAADGSGAHGAFVRLTGPSGTVIAHCATDGSFHAGERLPAGRYEARVEGHPIAERFPVRGFVLGSGAAHEVSFGPSSGLSRLTGRVMGPDGKWVTASDGIPEPAARLLAREGRRDAVDLVVVDGWIDQWLERGAYELQQTRAASSAPWVQRADPPTAPTPLDLTRDLVHDLQLEGFVLSGQIIGEPRDLAELGTVALRERTGATALRAAVLPDGAFRFVGVAAGLYDLRGPSGRQATVSISADGPTTVPVELEDSSDDD